MKIGKFILVCLIFGLLGCIKPPDIPKEPYIEYREIYKLSPIDSLVNKFRVVFYFRDGDGDIGIRNSEVDRPPFNQGTAPNFNPYSRNVWVTIQVKRNNQYSDVSFDLPNTPDINFFGLNQILAPPLEESLEQSRAIEGTINFDFDVRIFDRSHYQPNFQSNADSIRFKIRILDRAFNKSNEIITDPVILTTPNTNAF